MARFRSRNALRQTPFSQRFGNADPVNLYGEPLRQLDPALRSAFMGGNMVECFERMGDPLIIKSEAAA